MRRRHQPPESNPVKKQIERAKQDLKVWQKAEIFTLEGYIVTQSGNFEPKIQEQICDELRNCGEYTIEKLQTIATKYNLPPDPNHDQETYRHYLRGD